MTLEVTSIKLVHISLPHKVILEVGNKYAKERCLIVCRPFESLSDLRKLAEGILKEIEKYEKRKRAYKITVKITDELIKRRVPLYKVHAIKYVLARMPSEKLFELEDADKRKKVISSMLKSVKDIKFNEIKERFKFKDGSIRYEELVRYIASQVEVNI